jgi:putative transposase
MNQIFLYCLAVAARRTGILVHAYCVLSTHYHLVVTDVNGQLPEFLRWLNEFVAKCINAMLGRWEAVWSPGSYSAVRLEDSQAVLDRIIYTLVNPVAAGLVSHGCDWPGVTSSLGAAVIKVKRPPVFFRVDGPAPELAELQLSPPPGHEEDDYRARLARAVEDREAELRRSAVANARPFLGRRRVLAQSPWATPSTREARRRLRPQLACGDKWERIEALKRLKQFRVSYREAWVQYRAGRHDIVFPAGTYAMRLRFGVACAPC